MGAVKKTEMFLAEFEHAIETSDSDMVLHMAPEVLSILRDTESALRRAYEELRDLRRGCEPEQCAGARFPAPAEPKQN